MAFFRIEKCKDHPYVMVDKVFINDAYSLPELHSKINTLLSDLKSKYHE